MKNEMLEYWKYVLELNETLIESGKMHLKIFNRSIDLYNNTKSPEVRDMIGNIEMLENTRDEAEQSLIDTKKQILFAKLQVKSYETFGIGDINLMSSQSN